MLYFQHNLTPEADSDPQPPSLQGLITEDDEGTLVLLDWVFEQTNPQATPRRHESVLFRLPHSSAASPPSSTHPNPFQRGDGSIMDVSVSRPVTAPSPNRERDSAQTSVSLGLAVGLGVNLLTLVGGAYLLQASVPPSAIAQWEQTQRDRHSNPSQEQQQLDAQAQPWIEVAQRHAQQQNFQGAIMALEQIPLGSSYYQQLQPKLQEYRQKRDIRANWLLQQAYDAAANRDFTGALDYLRMIPPGTEARDRALEKLAQYQEQKTIHATWLLQQAYDQAAVGQFSEAIVYLQEIPQGTPAYRTAQMKLAEYTFKAQTQANLGEGSAIAPPELS